MWAAAAVCKVLWTVISGPGPSLEVPRLVAEGNKKDEIRSSFNLGGGGVRHASLSQVGSCTFVWMRWNGVWD